MVRFTPDAIVPTTVSQLRGLGLGQCYAASLLVGQTECSSDFLPYVDSEGCDWVDGSESRKSELGIFGC